MSERDAKGQCLCGAVAFEATLPSDSIQACHCLQCQTWTGGGPLYAIRVQNLSLTGADTIKTYASSDWGERAFCAECGSTLFWKMQDGDISFVSPGLLSDRSDLELREEIFVDHRPNWLPARAGAKQSTEADMKAQLTAFLEGHSS